MRCVLGRVGGAGALAAISVWSGRLRKRPVAACETSAEQHAQTRLRDLRSSLPLHAPPDLYQRRWLEVSRPVMGTPLCIAQFNVLADGLSGMDKAKGGFTESPVGSLDWDYRRGRLVEELLRHGVLPDVVTMQEVDHYYDWFEPVMRGLGYEGLYAKKPFSPCKYSLDPNLEDGCAIFWRVDKLSLIESEAFNYVLNGKKANQGAILATLQPQGAAPIVFAVSHLWAKKDAVGEQGRADQAMQLLNRLDQKGMPCVIGMDMNGAPDASSGADYPPAAYPAVLQHPMQLLSAYREVIGREVEYTTWKRRGKHEAKHTIDYIFIDSRIGVARVLMPPPSENIVAERLPGWDYPSDHLALMAELRLPPEPYCTL